MLQNEKEQVPEHYCKQLSRKVERSCGNQEIGFLVIVNCS